MLDPRLLRENPDAVRHATRVKRVASPDTVDDWREADEKRRAAQTVADGLRAEQKKAGKAMKDRLSLDDRATLQATLRDLKERIQTKDKEVAELESEANDLMLRLPAVPDSTWPIGADADENVVIRTWNPPGILPAPLADGRQDHIALGVALGILDFDRGVKIAGSRSYVVRGAGATLYHAVLRYAMDVITSRNHQNADGSVTVPDVLRPYMGGTTTIGRADASK